MYWLEDGRLDIPKGEPLTLNYRVLVHAGNADDAGIAALFETYEHTKVSTGWPPTR
jgi:hypothetical protein